MSSRIVISEENNITVLDSAPTGSFVFADGNLFASANGEWGLVPDISFVMRSADSVGVNGTGQQFMFNKSIVLDSDTLYAYELRWWASKTAGTTSHTISTGLDGGTATFVNAQRNVLATQPLTTIPTPNSISTGFSAFILDSDGKYLTGATAITSATAYFHTLEQGTIFVDNGGTLRPYYQLSAAPGGAYTAANGAYMIVYPIGKTSNVEIGDWEP